MELISRKEKMEIIRDITLEDDIFFSKCLDGSNECASLMLRIILGRDDLEVTRTETQKWMQSVLSHSVRLDVYATDRDGNLYDIEIQKEDDGAPARRARYYSSMIDASALGKGAGYGSLPETYVIFLTRGDALGHGRALCRIDRYLDGGWEPFGDGAHMVYASSMLADEGTELGHLMHDLRCANPGEMHYNELRERVAYFKDDTEGAEEMSSVFEEILQRKIQQTREESLLKGEANGLRKGRTEGLREGRQEVARSMVADGSIPLSKIAEFSGLTLSEVENIRKSIHT